ncbi:alpha/beta hydrolase family esterase [Nocardia sp. NBC_00416]|uniref:alpha/beta hydrolase family esterase n=1 Tax=Nocardia sp. NBC_00416 TaxID=2975991 RepID=UPI002E1F0C5C
MSSFLTSAVRRVIPGRNRHTHSPADARPRRRSVLIVTAIAVLSLAAPGPAQSAPSDPVDPPVPSAGCAAAPPQAGVEPVLFASRGVSGVYLRDVPADADRPLPVVLDLHGYLEPVFIQHTSTEFGAYGRAHGFITVTPQLLRPGLPRWDFDQGSADIGYLGDLLTQVESTLCVDTRRIYATGLSMGGFTTSSLGCQFADRIAAIAPVAGLSDFAWCAPARPIPVIALHGTADPIVAYEGGTGPNARLLPSPDGSGSADPRHQRPDVEGPGPQSIPQNAAAWAHRNGCGAEATEQRIADDVVRTFYPCPAGAEVELWSILGGGHIWFGTRSEIFPGALVGNDTDSISATTLIWDFFRTHPMQA